MTGVQTCALPIFLLRWTNTANHWLARITGSALVMMVKVNGTYTTVSSTPITVSPNVKYWLRFQCFGNQVAVKFWADGTAEPAAWTAVVTAAQQLVAGICGLYGYDAGGGGTKFDSYSVLTV